MARALNFWTTDSDGERWLINGPEIVVAGLNRPKKKGKRKMYTNRPKHGTKAWMSYIRGLRHKKNPGRKRATKPARRNMYSAGEVANRPRTRTVTKYIRAKRNPGRARAAFSGLMGMPGMETIAGAFAGMVVPNTLTHFTAQYWPASITGSQAGKYLVSAVNTVVPAWLVKKYVNRNVGNIMLATGIGALLYSVARDMAPSVFGLSGMGYQPMLGVYTARRPGLPNVRSAVPLMQSPMIASTVDRLNPATRF